MQAHIVQSGKACYLAVSFGQSMLLFPGLASDRLSSPPSLPTLSYFPLLEVPFHCPSIVSNNCHILSNLSLFSIYSKERSQRYFLFSYSSLSSTVSPSSHIEKAGFLILRTRCYKASSLSFYLVFFLKNDLLWSFLLTSVLFFNHVARNFKILNNSYFISPAILTFSLLGHLPKNSIWEFLGCWSWVSRMHEV